ncbi:hypothetical protein BDW02DRAFT_634212 [Decorospora gaudefroyi]|uniref:Uncharacterized protein n=1 Tax=Decorospora gaudefroyi TaxID=184978 RepID=A0A6A5JZI9_9PLEO|nr:hypothetical protein BDW02DRAFT_634212 [Decorospora gaudefroyi]
MVPTTIPIMGENSQLHLFSISKDETNAAIIVRMRKISVNDPSITNDFAKKIMYRLLIRKPVVGKGVVLKTSDLEAQAMSAQHVYKIKKDDTLTKLLFGSVPISENGSLYAYLVDAVQDGHAGYTEILCFYYAVSGRMASIWLLIALGLAVLLGFGVGVGTGDGHLGLDVGTGVLAVLTATTMEMEKTPLNFKLQGETHDAKPTSLEDDEMEDEQLKLPSLVADTSSPLLLAEDFSATSQGNATADVKVEMASLRNELQLASYEYAALEERHCKLAAQHRDLRKLCSNYNDVIQGSSSYEEQSASIEQLRTEAGWEGLRVKALEGDVLRPFVRKAGGLQALVSQMQSMQSLIEKAGGLRELEALVSDTYLLQISVDEVGGLQGLHNLISEARRLRSKQQDLELLQGKTGGPNGLMAKAAKYDKLLQAFTDIQSAPVDISSAKPAVSATIGTVITVAPPALATINPARASRMVSTPLEDDPDRDLYEAPPIVESIRKTGSNDIPLGRSGGPTRSVSQAHERATLKREPPDELPTKIPKRPRIDIGRASAILQASLVDKDTKDTRYHVSGSSWVSDRALSESGSARFGQLINRVTTQVPDSKTPTSIISSGRRSGPPMTKLESYQCGDRRGTSRISPIGDRFVQQSRSLLVSRYPIALWTGASNPYARESPDELKKAENIPEDLGSFLSSELTKFINNENVHRWNSMPPNKDTCVLRYLIDGHKPSGQPQERRACRICSSAWVRQHRPCALLLEVEGVRTVVFMPLRETLGKHTSWREKGYWMTSAE